MPEAPLMTVNVSEPARFSLSTLSEGDRRLVESWFDHLKNWRNDEFVRSHSHRLSGDNELYMLRTSSSIRIGFTINGDEITIVSVFRSDALDRFHENVEGAAHESV